MYFNQGMDLKYPPEKKEGVLANKSHSQLKALRDELRQLGLAEKQDKEQKQEEQKKALAEKYGNI